MSLRSTCLSVSALLLAGSLALTSCRHQDDPKEDPVPNPTAYTLAVPRGFPAPIIPADNQLTKEGVELGRMLFYEKMLSNKNTMACASCHQQSKAFTDGRALAVGEDGVANPRGTMSLANVAWSTQLTWDGEFTDLENQALKPLENPVEMHQSLVTGVAKLQASSLYPAKFRAAFGTSTITPALVQKALAQFERTLVSSNSRFDKYSVTPVGFSPDERAGLALYNTHAVPSFVAGAECRHCHTLPFMSSNYEGLFFNNGLDMTFADAGRMRVTKKAGDEGKFIAPTLRNIALTAPYMHDGRFKTLQEVLDHYSDHVQMNSPGLDPNLNVPAGVGGTNVNGSSQLSLSATQKRQLLAFLNTLTDSTFVNDKRFSSPF